MRYIAVGALAWIISMSLTGAFLITEYFWQLHGYQEQVCEEAKKGASEADIAECVQDLND